MASMTDSLEAQHATWKKWKTHTRDSAILELGALQRQLRSVVST
jgi:hypothetical protein